MKELISEKNELLLKLAQLEKRSEELNQRENLSEERKKRFRRTANEIERHFKCPVETCQKSYGSEGSLNQHLKLKHSNIYATLHINNPSGGGGSRKSDKISESSLEDS